MIDARSLIEKRRAGTQRQFLAVKTEQEAMDAFQAALNPSPLGVETVTLADALGRVLAEPLVAPVDVPAFDRANVDGFAVRAADTAGARENRPVRLKLTADILTPGNATSEEVTSGHASLIATGGMLPRGADAVVLVESTRLEEDGDEQSVLVSTALAPGSFITFAGTDIGRGDTVLRSGRLMTARDIGLAAAIGVAEVPVFRRPRIAVISTGDELVAPGDPLPRGGVYDSNAAIVAASLVEIGCEPVSLGIARDDEAEQSRLLEQGLDCDGVILSGGTSKGAGDISHEIVSRLDDPGIVVHGVAIKPGKPLCLGVTRGKPVVVLPGFPTSAIFTFHRFVAPVLRQLAGMPERDAARVEATLPMRVGSESGRSEFMMVGLMRSGDGLAAYPMGKNSGAVTSFSQADGFIRIDAQTEQLAAGTPVSVQLLSRQLETADLVTIGSHCVGLDYLLQALQQSGITSRSMHVGSQGGILAAGRGECDIAGTHLMDPDSGIYNESFLVDGLALVKGYRRMQGFVFRTDDARFNGAESPQQAVRAALADESCIMVNRNAGSGTRVLVDNLLDGARPPGYSVQTKSHNAVATSVSLGRADWGVAIEPVARMYGLGFLPMQAEHYDFAIPEARIGREPVAAFLALLKDDAIRDALRGMGFEPA